MSYFAPYIDDTGLHIPTYEYSLEVLVSAYRSIFGVDAEMSESVPDYQLLSVLAKALDDTSALVLQLMNQVLTFLGLIGVIVDPTTAGIGDSERALGYEEPAR